MVLQEPLKSLRGTGAREAHIMFGLVVLALRGGYGLLTESASLVQPVPS